MAVRYSPSKYGPNAMKYSAGGTVKSRCWAQAGTAKTASTSVQTHFILICMTAFLLRWLTHFSLFNHSGCLCEDVKSRRILTVLSKMTGGPVDTDCDNSASCADSKEFTGYEARKNNALALVGSLRVRPA